MNVLICILGLSPGVATGACYALVRDRKVAVDRLVTLTTQHPRAGDCEREIARELNRLEADLGQHIAYEGTVVLDPWDPGKSLQEYRMDLQGQMTDACRLRIPYEDINAEDSVEAFHESIVALVHDVYRDDNVYLCVTGGRKSMAAIAVAAVQPVGPGFQGIFHLSVADDIERDGSVDQLRDLPAEQRRRVLAPPLAAVKLIPLTSSQLTAQAGQLWKPSGDGPMDWDVFISHASEDKEAIARPLAQALEAQGLRVWFDEFTLSVGDRLRRSIDYGLANCCYGIVILSPQFFAKEWPQMELDGLIQRENRGGKVILPVWHDITHDQIQRHSPLLADRIGIASSVGLDQVVVQLLRAMGRSSRFSGNVTHGQPVPLPRP
jgi:CRISPR-associated protein (TIGR02584 family)